MKRIKFFLLLFCAQCLIVSPGFSQEKLYPIRGLDQMIMELNAHEALAGRADMTYANTAGTPFLFADFHTGKFILKSGESCDLDMRYDAYADQVHIKLKGNIFGISQPEKVASLKIDTLNFIYSPVQKKGNKTDAWFIVKTDGKCKLLVRKRVILKAAEPEKPYQPAVPATFTPVSDSYYMKLNDGSAVLIKNKSDILSVLGDRKNEISKFISTNKTGTKLGDLVKIVEYYNSL